MSAVGVMLVDVKHERMTDWWRGADNGVVDLLCKGNVQWLLVLHGRPVR